MSSRLSILRLHCCIEGHTTDVEHIGIVCHMLMRANVLFEELFELISVIILRSCKGKVIRSGILPIEQDEKIVQQRHHDVITIAYRMRQLLLNAIQHLIIFHTMFGLNIKNGRKVCLMAIEQTIGEEGICQIDIEKVVAEK